MTSVTTEQLRLGLRELSKRVVGGERVTVTYRGTPRFALVPIADLETLRAGKAKAKPAKRPKR